MTIEKQRVDIGLLRSVIDAAQLRGDRGTKTVSQTNLFARPLPTLKAQIKSALLALKDPWTSKPIVRAAHDREALFRGPFVERAPDLVLELCLDGDYSYNLMPSLGTKDVFRRLGPSEYLGRKGRSLAGSHRTRGLWVGAGPTIDPVGKIDAHILDASVSVLARMDIKAPKETDGRVLSCVRPREQAFRQLISQDERSTSKNDEALVSQRLRALGYID